jgi:HPt (histidine-containing phosphotransfer) domain-containing protein
MALLDRLALKTRQLKRVTGIERFAMEMNTAINHRDLQAREPQDNGEAVIDQRILINFWRDLDEDDSLIQDMVTLFLEEAPKQLMAAHRALANHDSKELGRIAHTLKGSSSYYGAKRLAIPCTALEDNCELGILTGAGSLLAQLEKEFEAVREVLKSMVFQLSLMRESK